jgi:hypothetical protein
MLFLREGKEKKKKSENLIVIQTHYCHVSKPLNEHVEKALIIVKTRDKFNKKISLKNTYRFDYELNRCSSKVRKRHIEQTTKFHACTVSKSIATLIDKNNRKKKNKIAQGKLQYNRQVNRSQH